MALLPYIQNTDPGTGVSGGTGTPQVATYLNGYSQLAIIEADGVDRIVLAKKPFGIQYVSISCNGIVMRRGTEYNLNLNTIILATSRDRFQTNDEVYVEYFSLD